MNKPGSLRTPSSISRHRLWCVRTAFRVIVLIFAAWVSESAAHSQNAAPPGWALVYDFLVQDVCLDHSGRVIPAVTPADGAEKCPAHRNLRIGENLPYHKHDWPAADDPRHPDGYSQNDMFPIHLPELGTAVVQARSLLGRAGGGLIVFSSNFAASMMTLDGTGFQVFYGPLCASSDPAQQVENAWIFVGRDFAIGRSGDTVARLTRYRDKCPNRLASSYTRWYSEPITLRVRSPAGGVAPFSLVGLVSDHFGGRNPILAQRLERFYFTREFGLVRWERCARWETDRRDTRCEDEGVGAVRPNPETAHRGRGLGHARMPAMDQYRSSQRPGRRSARYEAPRRSHGLGYRRVVYKSKPLIGSLGRPSCDGMAA